jgi:hypothetical protein
MTDSTDESSEPEQPEKHQPSSQGIPGVNTLRTPVQHRFDPPLEHRPYEEILAEVNAAWEAIQRRRFGRKKAK